MNAKLKKQLKDLGMNDSQIQKTEQLGGVSEKALAQLTVDDLTGIGLPVLIARAIVAEFNSQAQPTSAPQPPSPMQVVLKNEDPTRMRTRELLEAVAGGERDSEFLSELRRRVGNRSTFVRIPNGDQIDVNATLEVIEYINDTGHEVQTWDDRVTETLDEVLDKRRQADPLSGEPLQGNRAPDGVDWVKVSEANRVLAAFARQQGLLRGNEDRFQLASELEKANPGGRWANVLALFKRAERAEPEKIAAAKAALIYRRSQPGSMPPFAQGDLFQVPPNLPHTISLPDHVLYASVLTTNLTRQEMHEITQQIGERPGSICSAYSEDRTYARELVGHLSRRSRVYELIEALYRLHPRVNWAAELGLVEKAGTGDVVIGSKYALTGNFTGAQINIGNK